VFKAFPTRTVVAMSHHAPHTFNVKNTGFIKSCTDDLRQTSAIRTGFWWYTRKWEHEDQVLGDYKASKLKKK